MKLASFFLLGMLAAVGLAAALVLGRHPLARCAWHEAVQQDVEAVRGSRFWR